MTGSFQLRAPTEDEAEKLAELGRTTFIETFGHLYRPEDLKNHLAEQYHPEAIASELADPEIEHRVITDQDSFIGFIKLGPLQLPVASPLPDAHEIRQLYLLRSHTGKGLGKSLMNWAFDHLAKKGIIHLYLGVFSENHGAIRFYQNLGFRKCGEYQYPVGDQLDLEWIMEQSL